MDNGTFLINLLNEFITVPGSKPETEAGNELANILLKDENYIVGCITLFEYLCVYHPTLFIDFHERVINDLKRGYKR